MPPEWQTLPLTDSTGHPAPQFVYRDNETAMLRVEHTTISEPIEGLVDFDRVNIATTNPGYSIKSQGKFTGGTLPGIFFEFSTKQRGDDLTHYSYYLQTGTKVWILRFAGRTGRLEALRDAIDKIARAFVPGDKN